jgi:hypothetical protein
MAAAGMTASFAAVDIAAMATSASAANESDFARLRQCESGGNYRINTGNGYYGAYQFAAGTWRGLGYSGLPHQADPATQDAAARQLQSRSGWGQWPACARRLGLYGSGSSASDDSGDRTEIRASRSSVRRAAPVHHYRVKVTAAPEVPPPFVSALTIADQDTFRIGVHDWQARMAQRGWQITVDGYFGPQSAAVAKKFAVEKKLHQTGLTGEVDLAVWDAAWRLPVS